MSLLLAGLHRHALLRAKIVPALSNFERERTRGEVVHWLYSAVVAAISIAFAMLIPERSPNWLYGMPGMMYALLSLTGVVVDRFAPRTVPSTY